MYRSVILSDTVVPSTLRGDADDWPGVVVDPLPPTNMEGAAAILTSIHGTGLIRFVVYSRARDASA